jgi:hypothetical protein
MRGTKSGRAESVGRVESQDVTEDGKFSLLLQKLFRGSLRRKGVS